MSKPQIRFKGFEDEWELHPFSEIASRYSSLRYDENIPSVEYEDINSKQGSLNKDIFRKKIHKVGQYFQKGDVLFGKLRPYLGNNLLANFDGLAIGDFWIFKSGLARTSFIYPFLYSKEFSYISNISSGSKMPRSDWGLVSSWNFNIPMSETEQTLIGCIFSSIDKCIANAEREVRRLEKMKQASLQKMFPRLGATAPEIRFVGFKSKWEVRAVGSCFAEGTERGGFDNLLSVGITRGVYPTEDFIKTITVKDFSNYKTVHNNDIVYNSMRMWQGASGVSYFNGIVSPAYTVLTPRENVWSPFFAYLFKLPWVIKIFEANSQGLTKDTWNLKYPAISLIEFAVPSDMKEQIYIANYFVRLDDLITAKRQKVVKLRNIKQACLDKMFVNTSEL